EVVALARVAVVVGPGVAGAEEDEVLLRIVGAGHPDRSAAALPRVAAGRPTAAADRIVGRRDRVEAPRPLAGLRVVGVDEAADPELGAGDPDNHLVLHDERRDGG